MITQWLEGARELNDYVTHLDQKSVSAAVKHAFITSLAETVRDLHEKGVYHADLKSTNILVQEQADSAWRFSFIDLDRVACKDSLSFYERANNLAQINASVARLVDCKRALEIFLLFTLKELSFLESGKNITGKF